MGHALAGRSAGKRALQVSRPLLIRSQGLPGPRGPHVTLLRRTCVLCCVHPGYGGPPARGHHVTGACGQLRGEVSSPALARMGSWGKEGRAGGYAALCDTPFSGVWRGRAGRRGRQRGETSSECLVVRPCTIQPGKRLAPATPLAWTAGALHCGLCAMQLAAMRLAATHRTRQLAGGSGSGSSDPASHHPAMHR